MWQQDTTVVDSALQEALVDTIYVAVEGGGLATSATIFAAIVGAVAAIVITCFTAVTYRRDTKDRKERTLATDTKVSVRAYYIYLLLNDFTNKFPSGDEAFGWAKDFRAGSGPLQTDIQRLAEENPGASTPVSEAIRLAYVHFTAATVQITRATNQSELSIGVNCSRQAHFYLTKCAGYLLQAVDDGLKSAAEGVILTPPALHSGVTVGDEVTAELKHAPDEEVPNASDEDVPKQ